MSGLRAAIHQDPEVLMVGEMRDYETIRLVLEAVETGILVFATLHTNSAEKTLSRIVDVFPGDEQSQIRALLAESLNGVIAQFSANLRRHRKAARLRNSHRNDRRRYSAAAGKDSRDCYSYADRARRRNANYG